MDYEALLTNLAAESAQLGLRGDGPTFEAEAQLAALSGWLRPHIPVLAHTAELLNETYLLSLSASGIDIEPEDLAFHVMAVVTTMLAKLVASGALVTPPPC